MPASWTLPVFALLSGFLPGCVLGSEQSSGCRADHPEDCSQGWSCRSGVCVRPTTPLSPTADGAVDGAVDAPLDSAVDAPLDGAVDAPLDGAVDAPLDGAVDALQDTSDGDEAEISTDADGLED